MISVINSITEHFVFDTIITARNLYMKLIPLFLILSLVACGGEDTAPSTPNDELSVNQDDQDFVAFDHNMFTVKSDYTDLIAGQTLNKVSLAGTWAVIRKSTSISPLYNRTHISESRSIVNLYPTLTTSDGTVLDARSYVEFHAQDARCFPYLRYTVEQGFLQNGFQTFNDGSQNESTVLTISGDASLISVAFTSDFPNQASASSTYEMVKLSDDNLNFGSLTTTATSSTETLGSSSNISCFIEEKDTTIDNGVTVASGFSTKIYNEDSTGLIITTGTTYERTYETIYIPGKNYTTAHLNLSNEDTISISEADYTVPDSTLATGSGSYTLDNAIYTSTAAFTFFLNL